SLSVIPVDMFPHTPHIDFGQITSFTIQHNILKGKGQIYRFTDYKNILNEKDNELEYIEIYRLQEAKINFGQDILKKV
ncbi:hypothetical protein ACJX0J_015243, partial [Zea mays]